MKSLTDAMAFVKTWEGAIDQRDKGRFAEFVPFDRITEAGLELADGMVKLHDKRQQSIWTLCGTR